MEIADKLKRVIDTLSSLTPRVDQVATLSQPIAVCVNELVDVWKELRERESTAQPDEH